MDEKRLIPKDELAHLRTIATHAAEHPDGAVRQGAATTLVFLDHIAALETELASLKRPVAETANPDAPLKQLRDLLAEYVPSHSIDRARACLAAVERGLASLSPSGQVKEDAKELHDTLKTFTFYSPESRAEDVVRVDRLTAKAQGYEAIRDVLKESNGTDGEALARVKDLLLLVESLRRRIKDDRLCLENAEKERNAAAADNAALLSKLVALSITLARLSASGHADSIRSKLEAIAGDLQREYMVKKPPHPGAALLEQHRKEVALAKNDGLEEAATVVLQAVPGLKAEAENAARGGDEQRAASVSDRAERLETLAVFIRARKATAPSPTERSCS